MTDLTLLHTAEVHRATFDRLAARIAPAARLHHVVRPDWLARAQGGIGPTLAEEITRTIAAAPGPVLCSCTTLGPVAAKAGAIRIDTPMMAAAARTGGPVLMAYCLESTRTPSRALLEAAFADRGITGDIRELDLRPLWPLFEAAEEQLFASAIAAGVTQALDAVPEITCVVLAQASMAGAAALIATDVPILSSPELALRAALGLALD